MKKTTMLTLAAGAAIGVSGNLHAGINYSTAGSTYAENFNNFPTTVTAGVESYNGINIQYNNTAHIQVGSAPFPGGWKDDTTTAAEPNHLSLPGWHLYHGATLGTDTGNGYYTLGGANGHQQFRMGSGGTGSSAAFYAWAMPADYTEKALGVLSSSSLNGGTGARAYLGLQLVNTTGATLTSFTVQYDGEQWRDGGVTSPESQAIDGFDFQWSLSKTDGDWSDSTGYDGIADSFTSVKNGTTAVGLNGNDAANRTADITHTITGLNWTPGTELWIRWRDRELGGNSVPDDSISIDNVRFTAFATSDLILYWDIDGSTAGGSGGATPSGTWDGSAANFNTHPSGSGNAGGTTFTTPITTANDDVVFSAGKDSTGSYTVTVAGTQSAKSVTVARGSVTLAGGTIATPKVSVAAGATATVTGTLSTAALTKEGDGTYVAASTSALGTGTLAVSAGTVQVQAGLPTAVSLDAVTTAGTGKLDLTNNDLVVKNSTVAAVQALLLSGFNGGTWDGPGIQSSAAATAPNGFTALGYLSNADLGATEFSGVPVDADDVLVKYTYYGDADLSGNVTLDDYSQFLFGFQNPVAASWSVGDFDYSGTVTLDDFSVFLLVFQNQGGPLGGLAEAISADTGLSEGSRAAMLGAIAAVPEPGTLGALALAGVGLIGRRRARRV